MRLTGHHVAEIKRHIRPGTSPHHHAGSLRPGAIPRTCETYWKTTQDNQRGRATTHDTDRHAGYNTDKSGRAGHYRPDLIGLRRNIAWHRGAAHPLCFTDEVMEHEFPEGFKPVNIESYDGTTDPAVWIEDFLLHIHMARGDELHAIKYLPLKLKGPARHWLNRLPANSIGSWEILRMHSSITSRAPTCDHQMLTT